MKDEKRTDLIARLESATEGSRELDAEISVMWEPGEIVCWQHNFTMEPYPAIKRARSNYVGGFGFEHVPYYTTSLDAALTLNLFRECEWHFLHTGPLMFTEGKPFVFEIRQRSDFGWTQGPPVFRGAANTASLALCIAALKAKDSTDGR